MRSLEQLKDDVCAAIDAHASEIEDIARYIWKNPEPGFREFKTSKKAADVLRALGLTVQEGIAYTGLRADLNGFKPGPKVGLLGEMDSLIVPTAPEADKETGAFHACGHHTHITSVLGAAIGLCKADVAPEISGAIAFFGVPAEEGLEMEYRLDLLKQGKIQSISGKPAMIRAGALNDIDMAAMIHVGDSYWAMNSNAFVTKNVRFIGKAGHAAIPHSGINALNAANVAMHALGLMRDTFSGLDPRHRVHGVITKGGEAVNVIPADVRLSYMVRASNQKALLQISRMFDDAMRGGAMAVGAKVEIDTVPGDYAMKNDMDLLDIFTRNAERVIGQKINMRLSQEPGSTDMGDVSAIMPAIHPYSPGADGTAHGADFCVPDLRGTCVRMSKMLACFAVELLYGDAAKGRVFAERKKQCMSVEDYIKSVDAVSAEGVTQN